MTKHLAAALAITAITLLSAPATAVANAVPAAGESSAQQAGGGQTSQESREPNRRVEVVGRPTSAKN